jgi:hypothetical protein
MSAANSIEVAGVLPDSGLLYSGTVAPNRIDFWIEGVHYYVVGHGDGSITAAWVTPPRRVDGP